MKVEREAIYRTTFYRVEIREGVFDTVCKGHPCYALINTRTGVVEAEGLNEAEACMTAEYRTGQIREFEEAVDTLVAPDSGEIH